MYAARQLPQTKIRFSKINTILRLNCSVVFQAGFISYFRCLFWINVTLVRQPSSGFPIPTIPPAIAQSCMLAGSQWCSRYPETFERYVIRATWWVQRSDDAGPFASRLTCFVRWIWAKFQRPLHLADWKPGCAASRSMTHLRLNYLAVCHVHQEVLDLVDVNLYALIEEFVSRNKTCASMFGKWLVQIRWSLATVTTSSAALFQGIRRFLFFSDLLDIVSPL
jgi:hypothetical protein